MEVIHHIAFNTSLSPKLKGMIGDIGIKYNTTVLPGTNNAIVSFDISETDPGWEIIFALLKKQLGFSIYEGGDIYETHFTEEEVRKSDWLRLISIYEQGSPQPIGNWPIKQQSLINVCPTCAIHDQNRPFRFRKEPLLRKNSFMSLIGVGEIFATPEVFMEFEENNVKGFEAWEAMININKTNLPSMNVRQLYVPKTTEPGLIGSEGMRKVQCKTCGQVKFYPHRLGVMQINKNALTQPLDFLKTNEWFGTGLIAYREVLVSNRIANLILDKGWKGIRMKVVELV